MYRLHGLLTRSGQRYRAVVVAVACVGVVQVPVDQVVDVVSVRDLFVAAVGSVNVVGRVCATRVIWRASGRVGSTFFERVLVYVVAVHVVEVPFVQVVHVPVVRDCRVATAVAVLMGMVPVAFATHGGSVPREVCAWPQAQSLKLTWPPVSLDRREARAGLRFATPNSAFRSAHFLRLGTRKRH